MGQLMDLVAGDVREILLAVSLDDWAGLADESRFDAHLALGAGLDPRWLDRFAEAVRTVTRSNRPSAFEAARRELNGPGDVGNRTVERVDRDWVDAVARLDDAQLDAIAGHWIDLIEASIGALPSDEKPWFRHLVGQLVQFCRRADGSPDVIFAWSI